MHRTLFSAEPSRRLRVPCRVDHSRRGAIPLGTSRVLAFCRRSNARCHCQTEGVHFGWDYRYDSWTISPTEPIPQWLLPFRLRAADVMRVSMEAIQEVLITRYEPGAGIGWHRDAPMFGPRVLGVSLVGSCRMRFQRTVNGKRQTAEAVLSPRSLYVLTGAARFSWQHAIPPGKEWRYSVTFRTLKDTA